MNCQFRDFNAEKERDPSKVAELEPFQNVEDIHEYVYWTGVRMQVEQWDVSFDANNAGAACNADKNDGVIYLLVKRECNNNIWHKLMELWQAMVSIDALTMTTWQPKSALWPGKSTYLTAAMVPSIQVVYEDEDIGPVDELWGLITGHDPIHLSQLNSTCMGDVILPLAGSSSPFWESHWTDRNCRQKFMLDPFIRRIYRHLGIEANQRLHEETVVTIIQRRGGTRKIWNLESHVAHLQSVFPKTTFDIVDFATLNLRQQIETVSQTDVLVGVMGAGMTHILFLPEESTVAELMTPGTHYSGFRNLAKQRGLPYFTSHGMPKEEWEERYSARKHSIGVDAAKRDWQMDEYLYYSEEDFTALVAAAIHAQLNRGLRSEDVKAFY
jgi:hypothetical protein